MGLKKKIMLVAFIVSLLVGSSYSEGWAWREEWDKNDPVTDEWNALDLVIARPAGVLAGIAGAAFFVVTLPFTIPSGGVERAAERFIISPFEFSLAREYPDENM